MILHQQYLVLYIIQHRRLPPNPGICNNGISPAGISSSSCSNVSHVPLSINSNISSFVPFPMPGTVVKSSISL